MTNDNRNSGIYWTVTSGCDPFNEDGRSPCLMISHSNRHQLHENFIYIINQYSLTQAVTSPTCTQLSVNRNRKALNQISKVSVTSNILDLFLTNNPLLITNTKVIPGISDHDIVLIDADLNPVWVKTT